MKVRAGFLLSSAAGALLIGASALPGAMAADTGLPVKALPADTGWTWEGYAELGARFFAKKNGGATGLNWKNSTGTESLGKFYEYRDLRPGPFGNFGLKGLSNDGLYGIDFTAKNIGYRDQGYFLDLSKAGEHYLSVEWDQTPHIYNNHAGTIYNGIGSNTLTIPNSLRTTLFGLLNVVPAGTNPALPNAANAGTIANTINGNLNDFVLGFRRDTANVNYRWTPTSNWDITADYTRIRREGTQSQGALTYQFGAASPSSAQERGARVILELPKPIADTTHNADLNAEYAGTSPWGKKFNIALGYGFSAFQNDNASYSFQNPWVTDSILPGGGGNSAISPLTNTMSLAPDNSTNTIRLTAGADLPWNSRYNSAVNYTMARQNEGFLPYTSNPALNAGNVCVTGAVSCAGLGFFPFLSNASGLGNNTLLINNVLTTRLTSDLKSTLRYRYYDFDSIQNAIATHSWIYADALNSSEDTRTSYGLAFTKQNASADLTWMPRRWLNIGVGAAWERWDRDHRDVNVTNELSERVFADAQLFEWSRMRASYIHSERRYDTYIGVVESNIGNGYPTYRLFDMANRNRDKGNFYIDFYLPNSITLTPTAGFRFDRYGTDPYAAVRELGLLHDNAWDIGLEMAWKPSRTMTVMASYTHEESQRQIMAAFAAAPPVQGLDIQTRDNTNTFIFGVNLEMVPDKLDVKGTITAVRTFGGLAAGQGPGTTGAVNSNLFPDVHSSFDRLDVMARYRFDRIQQAGMKLEPFVKLRYLWERNATDDWAPLAWNYMYNFAGQTGATFAKGIMLGWDNPNYNIQAVMISAGVKW
jgi:Putative outer membrane beta-barrel porin, MtrB/PioB